MNSRRTMHTASTPTTAMRLYYTAVHRFDPECAGERWRDYIAWSGLEHLKEVISLDSLLCPNFFESPTIEDWEYNVQEDNKLHLFHDLDYVVRRTIGRRCMQALGVIQAPTAAELAEVRDPRLEFCGFDLVETEGGISALVNCGGFERSFSNQELNPLGLISQHERALEVQACLAAEYPDEPHAHCDVWALFRYSLGS